MTGSVGDLRRIRSPIVVAGDGLVLREWDDGDVSIMVSLFDTAEMDRRTPLESPFDLDAARRAVLTLLPVIAAVGLENATLLSVEDNTPSQRRCDDQQYRRLRQEEKRDRAGDTRRDWPDRRRARVDRQQPGAIARGAAPLVSASS